MAQVQHETFWFAGRVQGVGFRYATVQIAKEYEVAGYVTNLDDGRVLIDVEGESKEIGKFINAVQERLHGFIRSLEKKIEARTPQFSGFVIR